MKDHGTNQTSLLLRHWPKHSLDSIVERYTTTMPRKVIITRHIRVLRMGTLVQSRCCPVEERLRGGQYGEIQR